MFIVLHRQNDFVTIYKTRSYKNKKIFKKSKKVLEKIYKAYIIAVE